MCGAKYNLLIKKKTKTHVFIFYITILTVLEQEIVKARDMGDYSGKKNERKKLVSIAPNEHPP